MLRLVRIETGPLLLFQAQHSPFYTNLTFACKTEPLGSLYSHALLKVVHEQKFKDLLSSTCQLAFKENENETLQTFSQA